MNGFFVTGGTMKPGSPSYIERAADEQLYEAVLQGEYCNVLTTRQMGKSSLMARTADRLRQSGIACATVDLQGKGTDSPPPDQWYYGVVKQIATGLGVGAELSGWWKQQEFLLPAQKFTDFFAEIVLNQISGKVVIFIDEVDWMIRLKFSDEFFAAIRSCFNRRATEPAFGRLTFVLLGSAAPAQLIRDPTRTPFNIGRGVELTDFTPDEARKLEAAFKDDGDQILARILYWTDGHPYLTQNLCQKAAETPRSDIEPQTFVDSIVNDTLLSTAARSQENNLKFVEDRLGKAICDSRAALGAYRRILRGQNIADQPASAIHTALRLSGAVKPDKQRNLRVRNRIYQRVFDKAWVSAKAPRHTVAIALTVFAASTLLFLTYYLLVFPKQLVDQLETAYNDVPYGAYAALHKPLLRARADELFAQFWERRGNRDEAILVRARAGQMRQLGALIGNDFPLLVQTFRHEGAVFAVAFSPDGTLVATGSGDGTARVFEAATGREVWRLSQRDLVDAVAFSPDGKLVATGSGDGTARVFEAATGQEVSRLSSQVGVNSVAFSPDGKLVAAGSWDKTARVFEAATGREVSRLSQQGTVYRVAFSPDGKLVATGSGDGTARVFEAATGQEVSRLSSQGGVDSVAFSPDGKLVATGSADDTARVFEAATGREVSRLSQQGTVHWVAFSPDGELVATGSADNTARVFEAATGREVSRLSQQGSVNSVAFSPDGKLVATGSSDNTARVFEAATGREVSRLSQQGSINAVAFSPDRKLVATGSDDSTSRVFEAATGQEVSRLSRQVSVNSVAFSPDGKLVATGSYDKTARVFEAATGREVSRLSQQGTVETVAFSPDGKLVATGSSDKTARVFDAATGQEVSRLSEQGTVWAVAFSPDGKLVATGSYDKTARVFEAASGREVSRLSQQGTVETVAFSPDGKLVATGSADNTARVFEAATGREVSRLNQQGTVYAVAFSPDGKLVAAGSEDDTARVFEAASGREVSRLSQQGTVFAVAFSPDGKFLLTEAKNWLSLYRRDDTRWRPVVNRYFPGIWPTTIRFVEPTNNCAHCVELIRDVPGNLLKPDRLNFDEYPEPQIKGTPSELVSEWSAKLGLTFDSQGHIVPLQQAPGK